MNKLISPYGLSGVIGVLAGMVYLWAICHREHGRFEDMIYVYVWAAVGAIFGAKTLYIIVNAENIIHGIRQGEITFVHALAGVMRGGFVFYGGLFGALIFAILSAKFFMIDIPSTLSTLIPCMPLAHAFGRVGCHFVGCCYGIESSIGCSIVYHSSQYAPNGIRLFPVQLTEAVGDIIIFIILVFLGLKRDKSGIDIVFSYMGMYAILRFCLEFVRGDEERGFIGKLSISQWISVVIIAISIQYFVYKDFNTEPKHG